MIPRHDGLVPEMRFAATAAAAGSSSSFSNDHSQSHASSASPPQQAAPTFTRFMLFLPEQVEGGPGPSSVRDAQPVLRATTERDARLYSFLPSSDCATAPVVLQATMVGDVDSAGIYVSTEGELEVNDDEGVFDVAPGREKRGRGAPKRTRALVKDGEPCRLLYLDSKSHGGDDLKEGNVTPQSQRLISIALPEYEHLTCTLLEPAGANRLVTRVLDRPVMELRPERVAAERTGEAATASSGGNGNSRGISSMWLSVPSAKFNKSDWQSMDAIEKAEATASRGGNDSEEDIERRMMGDAASDAVDNGDGNGGPARKMARMKPSSASESAAFTRSMHAALAHNREKLATELSMSGRLGDGGVSSLSPYPHMGSVPSSMAGAGARPPSLPPLPSPSPQQTAFVVPVSASVPRPCEPAPRTRSRAPGAISASAETAPSPPHAATPSPDAFESVGGGANASAPSRAPTLDDCGRAVISKLRAEEQRQYASLKELEKLILRRLSSYPEASAKMSDPARKHEAVAWFRQMQKELKLWLIQFGCTIDPTGLVSFPTGK